MSTTGEHQTCWRDCLASRGGVWRLASGVSSSFRVPFHHLSLIPTPRQYPASLPYPLQTYTTPRQPLPLSFLLSKPPRLPLQACCESVTDECMDTIVAACPALQGSPMICSGPLIDAHARTQSHKHARAHTRQHMRPDTLTPTQHALKHCMASSPMCFVSWDVLTPPRQSSTSTHVLILPGRARCRRLWASHPGGVQQADDPLRPDARGFL